MSVNWESAIQPDRSALIVIDKQRGYFDPGLVAQRGKKLPEDSAAVLDRIDSFVEHTREAGIPVVWTLMSEAAGISPYPISELIATDSNGAQAISVPGTPSYEFMGRTQPYAGELVIHKNFYDAFTEPSLNAYLRDNNRDTVILVGGYATRCGIATAIGANNHGKMVVMPRDLVTNQAHTTWEMPAMFAMVDAILGKTVESDEILQVWRRLRS